MDPEKILSDVVRDLTGDDVMELVALIKGKSHVSEFKIAEKLDFTVNHVRNMFYRLEAHSLVDFVRKKDKKKGWYVYFWTLDMIKLRDLAVHKKGEMVSKLRGRLRKEKVGEFFNCPDKHIRVNLENAMEYNFRCPECNLQLKREENKKVISSIMKQMEKLTEEVKILKSLEIKPVVERKLTRERKKEVEKKVKKKTKKLAKKTVKMKPKKVKARKKPTVEKRTRKIIKRIIKRKIKKKKSRR